MRAECGDDRSDLAGIRPATPLFIEKVRDIVGLYLHPPERAVVLCVDEKSQMQALDRTLLGTWGKDPSGLPLHSAVAVADSDPYGEPVGWRARRLEPVGLVYLWPETN